MTINTPLDENVDVDIFMNTLDAEAGRFLYSDPDLRMVLLRAQHVINVLKNEVEKDEQIIAGLNHMLMH